ncbi:hypothetical protein IW140_004080 [Coemansia sp. RSA 1813]|nr:hypothetical protein EV178_004133 [Coemansia sp. RSA 1646]KAJ1768955.1 hypothetical protein LPJ74_004441 [Coemansia sp. RSA 1843]KAJ2088318.1 hypothetical protein IW138_004295 [Coemansia sp. RSA 986]KAJ2213342.1 hypothetical protein EV179_003940 [Coemansia sp. RSA 487]KAJ2568174.1 hypothetical protein IW140_004080 [Coemansia sp. RSA 1813]
MFGFATKTVSPLRQLCARGFASRAIYLGNVSHLTTAEKLQEIFGEYGSISGIRLSTTGERYRYAHIYYGAGEPPLDGNVKMYMTSSEPTHEEIEKVDMAVAKALQNAMVEIDGNTVYVKMSSPKKPRGRDTQVINDSNSISRETHAFKRGFTEGYRQAQVDARNQSSSR